MERRSCNDSSFWEHSLDIKGSGLNITYLWSCKNARLFVVIHQFIMSSALVGNHTCMWGNNKLKPRGNNYSSADKRLSTNWHGLAQPFYWHRVRFRERGRLLLARGQRPHDVSWCRLLSRTLVLRESRLRLRPRGRRFTTTTLLRSRTTPLLPLPHTSTLWVHIPYIHL